MRIREWTLRLFDNRSCQFDVTRQLDFLRRLADQNLVPAGRRLPSSARDIVVSESARIQLSADMACFTRLKSDFHKSFEFFRRTRHAVAGIGDIYLSDLRA